MRLGRRRDAIERSSQAVHSEAATTNARSDSSLTCSDLTAFDKSPFIIEMTASGAEAQGGQESF